MWISHTSHAASLWVFFAACGVAELAISFAVCTPLERFWPLTRWPKRNPIAADVTYAFFVRIVLFPLIAYFEFSWLRQALDGFLRVHSITPPSLPGLFPAVASWPATVFVVNFAILDLADYWRHRVSHRIGWWYGIHSLHHAEEQLTFWSDDRSHVLEDAITYVWLISVGLAIGVPGMQFPFLILLLPVSRQHIPREHTGRLWMAGRAHIYLSPIPSHASRVARCGKAQLQLRNDLVTLGHCFRDCEVSRQHGRDWGCWS